MAVDSNKIREMMEGKTLTHANIERMCDMVAAASDPEDKKKVMKHSVFFAGQLPLDENHMVDVRQTRRLLRASMSYDEAEDCYRKLMDSLTTQKFFIKKDEDRYEANEKYENTIVKARKIAKAYRLELDSYSEDEVSRARKMYQAGTRHYNMGDYGQAEECFRRAVDIAGLRMAYFSLGQMYHEGKGVDKSDKKALYYLSNAMIRGVMLAEPMETEIIQSL